MVHGDLAIFHVRDAAVGERLQSLVEGVGLVKHLADGVVSEVAEPRESLLSLLLDTVKDLLEDDFHFFRRGLGIAFEISLSESFNCGLCFDLGDRSDIQLRLDSAFGLDLSERGWGSGGLLASEVKGFRGVCGEERGEDELLRFVCLHDLSLFGWQV